MFPVIIEKGKTVYNWKYIDDLLDLKVKPFVELAFLPTSMAAENSKTVFWWKANITPANDSFEKWHDLVKAFTQHYVDRYGIDEVLTWYFEVWNEPNLYKLFWDGTKSQYFELYKQSVIAVRSVDNRLKVGGPLRVIMCQILVLMEKRQMMKLQKLFLTRFAKSLKLDLEWLNKTIAKSEYPDVEIHLTEWNTRDPMHDRLPVAAYIVKSNLDCIGLINSLAF
ncbi:hypothetical protein [Polaribacter sp. R2A056_3_33]|jgi:beta-xylosidase|uniref:GH39 family glycosyl hydrolase n=1 Tax=Polaribacter sp. R2A056_3_33 TaxID=2745563 RepID=UPI0020C76302|nr:hypothetical protein [Polaribacter sp. R2A056_3_33]